MAAPALSRVTEVTFHQSGEVTLWLEGARLEEDYHPAYHRLRQRDALAVLARIGAAPGCRVRLTNPRDVEQASHPLTVRAGRFALKAGIPFHDYVTFPHRATYEDAREDLARYRHTVTAMEAQGYTFEPYFYGEGWYPGPWRIVVREPLRGAAPALRLVDPSAPHGTPNEATDTERDAELSAWEY